MQQNDFLASLQREGEIKPEAEPKEEDKEKNPPASPAENKPKEDEKGSQPKEGEKPEVTEKDGEGAGETPPESIDKPIPFHQHPRWIAQQSELQELRDFRDKAMPLLDKLTESKPAEENTEIPEWFTELFGENDAAWKKYRAYDMSQREQLRSEIVTEFQGQSERLAQEEKKADQWLNTEIAKLADEGLKFDRNELLKVALEYLPTDNEGNISLKKAYQIMQGVKPAPDPAKPKPADEKKQVADKTMQKGKTDDAPKGYKTSNDLRHRSFTDFIPTE